MKFSLFILTFLSKIQICFYINFVLENKDEAEKRAKKAFENVKSYTWEKRAENIINFIKNN